MRGSSGGPRARLAPPRAAEWVLRWLLRDVGPADREAIEGDLAEEWAERVAEGGSRGRVAGWYWGQVIGCVRVARVARTHARGQRRHEARQREGMMRWLLQDVRYGLRSIRKAPAFALVVMGTLALGIAANTVVFSTVDGVVLRPFPFPDMDRLVGVGTQYPRLGGEMTFWENLSAAEYLDIRQQSRALAEVVAWDMGNRSVTVGEATENLFSAFWWGDAFPTLGMPAQLGRGFTEEELTRGDRVAILSDRVWRGKFGADPALVGGRMLMNGEPWTVVGIMPPGALIYGTDLWLPMWAAPERFARNQRQFQVLARLAPGATLAQANAELATIAARVTQAHGAEFEEYAGWRMQAMTWRDVNIRALKPAALILMGAVGFVLLLVVANVASLLLARGATRQREIAVRAALGAGRRRILGQLLTECVVLALAGGVVGALLGWAGVRGVSNLIGSLSLPIPGAVTVNLRVLAVTAAVSVGVGLAFGLLPALHASRFDLQRALQAESAAVAGNRARQRMQRVLVGVEVALALALVAGSGLLLNSFLRLRNVEAGFDAANVLTMRLTLANERYTADRIEPFFSDLRERVGAIPGVIAVATASQFPPIEFTQSRFRIEGRDVANEGALPVAFTTIVSPDYFAALRIPVLRGRGFEDTDRGNAPRVTVLNEAAARRYFGNEEALGQRLRVGDGPWLEVVGVVASTRNRAIDAEPEPELFASSLQASGWSNQMFLMVRTQTAPRAVLPAVREAVRAIDPQQPVYLIRTLQETVAATQATRRLSMSTLTLFGLFALLLAGVGIYAVVAYAVSQRRRELGVRLALGAERGQLRRMVLRQAMLPVLIGGAVGLAGAMGLGSLMSSLLFGVKGSDPLTLAAAAAVLGGTALLASYVPARRASRLDPVRALRLE